MVATTPGGHDVAGLFRATSHLERSGAGVGVGSGLASRAAGRRRGAQLGVFFLRLRLGSSHSLSLSSLSTKTHRPPQEPEEAGPRVRRSRPCWQAPQGKREERERNRERKPTRAGARATHNHAPHTRARTHALTRPTPASLLPHKPCQRSTRAAGATREASTTTVS